MFYGNLVAPGSFCLYVSDFENLLKVFPLVILFFGNLVAPGSFCLYVSDFENLLKVFPLVHVSEMKWSFLNNGAVRCLQDVYTDAELEWALIKCLNNPVGRYLSFIVSAELKSYTFFLKTFFSMMSEMQVFSTEGKGNLSDVYCILEPM